MGEKSSLALLEIILHALCAVCCIGVLVSCAITLSNINDNYDNATEGSDEEEDIDRYRAVAGWLLAVAIAGIVTQIILLFFRALFFKEVIISHFVTFGILCAILTILLALALIAGGIPSALNAAEVQDDYLDISTCDQDNLPDHSEEACDDLRRLRDSQAAAAGLAFIGAGVGAVITVLVLVATAIRRDG